MNDEYDEDGGQGPLDFTYFDQDYASKNLESNIVNHPALQHNASCSLPSDEPKDSVSFSSHILHVEDHLRCLCKSCSCATL